MILITEYGALIGSRSGKLLCLVYSLTMRGHFHCVWLFAALRVLIKFL